MAGPTCEVLIPCDDSSVLLTIDTVLIEVAQCIERTRKGRVWDVWVSGRPVHVWVEPTPPRIGLAAGDNAPEDYAVLRRLAAEMALALDGLASEPMK